MNNSKNSSYYKLFRYAVVVVVSILIIIGVIIVSISSSVYKKYRLNALRDTGDLFISCLKDDYTSAGNVMPESLFKLRLHFMDEYGLRIYVYNAKGESILSDNPDESVVLPLIRRLELDDNDYLDINTTSFSSSEPMMMYETQFFLKSGSSSASGTLTPVKHYAVFYSSTEDLNSFTMKITLFYAIFAAAGMALTYLLLKRRVRRHIDFENDFLRISERYSKGDFTEKLPADMPGSLASIAEAVNVLAANVESSEETSKTFIANVSHELRTPMTTIGGFVDGILDGTIKKSRQNEYLILVSKEIKRLRILISSMLNMTRFESGTMRPNFHETNLTDLVIQTVLMFEKKIEDKQLEVEGLDSDTLTAVVDADLMQQVIYNLVENAVKFVNDSGTLSFSFEKHEGICIVGIRNTGEGLQNSEIQQVFDRFYKTDSSRGKDTTGLGLGLSISRKIIHLHNGHIVVKSVYGEYTEFQIQIPEDPTKVQKEKSRSNK